MALVKGEGNLNSFIVAVITLFSYWAIGFVIYIISKESDQIGAIGGMGLVYVLAWILLYPYRTLKHYNFYKDQYKKPGITKFQYLFGKRIKYDKS